MVRVRAPKLDVALSRKPAPEPDEKSVSPPYGPTRTPAEPWPAVSGSSAGLTSKKGRGALSARSPRAASGVMYPTPALASADDLRDEAPPRGEGAAEAAIAALTEREEARDSHASVPDAPFVTETGIDSGDSRRRRLRAVLEAVVPETRGSGEEAATPEPKLASMARNEDHLDARDSTPQATPRRRSSRAPRRLPRWATPRTTRWR